MCKWFDKAWAHMRSSTKRASGMIARSRPARHVVGSYKAVRQGRRVSVHKYTRGG